MDEIKETTIGNQPEEKPEEVVEEVTA